MPLEARFRSGSYKPTRGTFQNPKGPLAGIDYPFFSDFWKSGGGTVIVNCCWTYYRLVGNRSTKHYIHLLIAVLTCAYGLAGSPTWLHMYSACEGTYTQMLIVNAYSYCLCSYLFLSLSPSCPFSIYSVEPSSVCGSDRPGVCVFLLSCDASASDTHM